MNTVKHTLGPWITSNDYCAPESGINKVIIIGPTVTTAVAHGPTVEEARANAKLIAAAPELLEALQNLITQVQQDCSIGSDPKYLALCERTQEAMQAIKKATE